jgi:hypothetical protein
MIFGRYRKWPGSETACATMCVFRFDDDTEASH